MDEILSSIRQIIADDDASAAPAPARPPVASVPLAAATPTPGPMPAAKPAAAPLALSPAQIVELAREAPGAADFSAMLAGLDEPEPTPEPAAELMGEAELLDPEDVAFEMEPAPAPEPPPVPQPAPTFRAPLAEPRPAPRPVASVAGASSCSAMSDESVGSGSGA